MVKGGVLSGMNWRRVVYFVSSTGEESCNLRHLLNKYRVMCDMYWRKELNTMSST